jgi:DNA polymerase-3 subunit delta
LKIHGSQLQQRLKQPLPPLLWISGDETLLIQEAMGSVRASCKLLGFSEREIWHGDSSMSWEDLLLSANNLSLFAERKLIDIRFSSAKPGDKAIKALSKYMLDPNPACQLVVSSPKLDSSAMRSKGFKLLEAKMLLVQVWPVEIDKLPGWIASRLKEKGLRAEPVALEILAERVQGNLLAAQQEIDKLVLLADGDVVDSDSVVRAVTDSARYDVFGLADQVLKGDTRTAHRMLLGLRAEGTDATVVLWAIAREIRQLLTVRSAVDKGQRIEAAMERQRIFSKRQTLFRQACLRLDIQQLQCALQLAGRVDYAIKGLAKSQPWDGLAELVLLLCGRPALMLSNH